MRETAERNVEIKVVASYSNATRGTRAMNRTSFVELERVGGDERYKGGGRGGQDRTARYNANALPEGTVGTSRMREKGRTNTSAKERTRVSAN